jgi:hypothetical protein
MKIIKVVIRSGHDTATFKTFGNGCKAEFTTTNKSGQFAQEDYIIENCPMAEARVFMQERKEIAKDNGFAINFKKA